MGDAYSDAAKVSRAEQKRDVYLRLLVMYLANNAEEEPTAELLAAAKESGLFENDLFVKVEDRVRSTVRQLRNDDPVQWAELLGQIKESDLYDEVKTLSPFEGRILVLVSCEDESDEVYPRELKLLARRMIEGKKMPWKPGHKFVIALPESITGFASVTKLGR